MRYRTLETVRSADVARLRELGKQLAEIAADPLQEQHRAIWTAVNDGKMTKPAILARDYPIHLINIDNELTPCCEDEFLASVEAEMLVRIHEWQHLRCHRVVEPYINCQADVRDTGLGLEASSPGSDDILTVESEAVSSAKHFERILNGEEDLEKLRNPEVIYDEKSTQRRLEVMNEIFAGILDVKLHGVDYFQYVPWDDLLSWMGIEEGMYDFVLNPEFMHKAIKRYTDAFIHRAKQYEALGLLSSNNTNYTIGSGGYGYTSLLPRPTASGVGAKLKDVWGFAADQIMTSVSPEMSEEFAFANEKPYADLFGQIYYGCCERLDHKLDEIAGVFSNLRKMSVSPYADVEQAMEKMSGGDVIVSFKANSNHLAVNPPEYGLLRAELENVCRLAKEYGCNVEILMKTIITLRGEPQRLWKWCDIAMEVLENY